MFMLMAKPDIHIHWKKRQKIDIKSDQILLLISIYEMPENLVRIFFRNRDNWLLNTRQTFWVSFNKRLIG